MRPNLFCQHEKFQNKSKSVQIFLKVKVVLNISNITSWLIAIHPKNHFVYGLGKAYGADKITINVENQQKPNRTLWMRSLHSIYKTKVRKYN